MKSLRFFKMSEFNCKCCDKRGGEMAKNLVLKLDKMRHEIGEPIFINSGIRCYEHNRKVGGSTASAHLTGLAVDIHCMTSRKRFKLIESAMNNGINRIGVYRNFIHLDIDPRKDAKVIWYSADRFLED